MTYRLLVSNNADLQLEKILRYVAIKLDNPTAFGYRKIKLRDHDYVILFRLADDIVQISGIFHMRENYIMKL